MREIKFRAWNKEEKEFIYYNSLRDIAENWLFGFEEMDELVWKQYTGLKTTNGKEIYEGDIVMHGISDTDKGQIIFGEYANPWGGDEFTKHMGFYVEWFNNTTRKDLGFWVRKEMEFEVIGNIYENPELLK